MENLVKARDDMKVWTIPVIWEMVGTVEVAANTLEEAVHIAQDGLDVLPIPDNGEFLSGSWDVDCYDEVCLREYYNNGQEDSNIHDYPDTESKN